MKYQYPTNLSKCSNNPSIYPTTKQGVFSEEFISSIILTQAWHKGRISDSNTGTEQIQISTNLMMHKCGIPCLTPYPWIQRDLAVGKGSIRSDRIKFMTIPDRSAMTHQFILLHIPVNTQGLICRSSSGLLNTNDLLLHVLSRDYPLLKLEATLLAN